MTGPALLIEWQDLVTVGPLGSPGPSLIMLARTALLIVLTGMLGTLNM